MGKEFEEIDQRIQDWIEQQPMFFVATAPLSETGLVNCSPKGGDALRVLGPRRLGYADWGGSGIETVAHLRENGRVVIMLCAFQGPPKIFRFYGRGSVIEPQDAAFDSLGSRFPEQPSIRNIIVIDLDLIMDSCGYGVPLMEFSGHRNSMRNWVESKSEEEILEYRRSNNAESLERLPGLRFED